MRKRDIKKYGNTWVIKLEPADVTDFGLTNKDKVDIDDIFKLKFENKKKRDKK